MKSSVFEKIIRKVVREEIDYALRREMSLLKEGLTTNPQVTTENRNEPSPSEFQQKLREQYTPPTFNSGDSTLDSLLNETAITSTPPNTEYQQNLNDPTNQFVNKDYSQLMNAMDKNKNFRP
tara:strand:- start:340 stop:705 length:366 start_codon:yes stop_codon:yes gene_type:complete